MASIELLTSKAAGVDQARRSPPNKAPRNKSSLEEGHDERGHRSSRQPRQHAGGGEIGPELAAPGRHHDGGQR